MLADMMMFSFGCVIESSQRVVAWLFQSVATLSTTEHACRHGSIQALDCLMTTLRCVAVSLWGRDATLAVM